VNSDSHDFSWHEDGVFIAACDVYKAHLDAAVQTMGGKVDAVSAGKDVYVEKPLSNTLPAALHVDRGGYRILPVPSRGANGDTALHTRNFLDFVKSRQKPICELEIGFYSSLPCLLALMAIQRGRSLVWDGKTAKPA
jgi:hypothetical protein